MTLAESFAWSAIVVSGVALTVWLIGSIVKRLGIALGVAPAWAVLASIPLLTAASFAPIASLWRAKPETASSPTPSSSLPDIAIPNVSISSNERPLITEAEASRPIRPDEFRSAATPKTWKWSDVRDRVEPGFRFVAPWLAGAMLIGLLVGWLRLAVGWTAVQRLARTSRSIKDAELQELLDVLRAELSCSKPVELKESEGLASPAAVGWRRPVVLLPTEWRQWSEAERRAILAHELAHVKRGDYVAWVVAQACSAAHFFNPLVRGVSHWLRMEQECSADADAARLAGGRLQYLRVLASLAIRQRDVSSSWPARCFLPTRGSFVRRIEMLRSDPPRWSVRTAAGNAFLAVGVVAVGLALSVFKPALAAPASNVELTAEDGAIPIPQTAVAAGQLRVAELLKNPQIGPLAKNFAARFQESLKASAVKIDDIDRVGLVVLATDNTPGFDGVWVFKTKTSVDAAKLFASQPDVHSSTESGVTVYRNAAGIVAVLLDDKTIVGPESPRIGEKAFRAMTGPRHVALQKLADQGSGSVMSFATSGSEFFGAMVSKPNPGSEMLASLVKPMVDGQQSMLLRLDVAADVRASVDAGYLSAETAKTAAKTAEAGLTLLSNLLVGAEARMPKSGAESDLLKLAKTGLASTKVQTEGDRLSVKAQLEGTALLGPLAAAISQTHIASQRLVSANNLKQIALAMFNFEAANQSFPAAAKPEGEGKFPVSWRVRILPYIEQEALYREYKMDEPWDGPNNKKLLDKMPRIYQNPSKPSKSETLYQVLVGDNTTFPSGRGVKLSEITDGTSNTFLVVEALKTVPWTKPEDVVFPFSGALPFGGVSDGGFNVAFADGSVRFMSNSIDMKVLMALITRNGGELINQPVADPARP